MEFISITPKSETTALLFVLYKICYFYNVVDINQ